MNIRDFDICEDIILPLGMLLFVELCIKVGVLELQSDPSSIDGIFCILFGAATLLTFVFLKYVLDENHAKGVR